MKTTRITVKDSVSVLAFASTGNEYCKKWDRFLTVEGKAAYHMGNTCDTCAFFFERLEGANQSISPTEISDRLRQGLQYLDESLLFKIKSILPDGDYVASLLEVLPVRVISGTKSDYFSHEQIELWGIDGFGIYRTIHELSTTELEQKISAKVESSLNSSSQCFRQTGLKPMNVMLMKFRSVPAGSPQLLHYQFLI